jgi:hypothetical protein
MKSLLFAILPMMLLVACRRPEVDAFARNPPPIAVSFQVPSEVSRNAAVRGEYAAALRAKLATCVMVVPEGEPAPEPSAELQVVITRIRPHAEPSPAVIGTATGVTVGTLGAMSGDRGAFFEGLFWGLWAGTAAAESRDWDNARLGYAPVRVSATVRLERLGVREPLMEFTVRSRDVIEQMGPLGPADRNDGARVREEEAKAFARVVVSRLQERFHWLPLPEPSYYTKPIPTP